MLVTSRKKRKPELDPVNHYLSLHFDNNSPGIPTDPFRSIGSYRTLNDRPRNPEKCSGKSSTIRLRHRSREPVFLHSRFYTSIEGPFGSCLPLPRPLDSSGKRLVLKYYSEYLQPDNRADNICRSSSEHDLDELHVPELAFDSDCLRRYLGGYSVRKIGEPESENNTVTP